MSRIIHKSGIPKPVIIVIVALIIVLILFAGVLGFAILVKY